MKFSIKDFFSKCGQIRGKLNFLCSVDYIVHKWHKGWKSNQEKDEMNLRNQYHKDDTKEDS